MKGWCGWFYTLVYDYMFHGLTVNLHFTFTVPPIGGTFGAESDICGEGFCGNCQGVKIVG